MGAVSAVCRSALPSSDFAHKSLDEGLGVKNAASVATTVSVIKEAMVGMIASRMFCCDDWKCTVGSCEHEQVRSEPLEGLVELVCPILAVAVAGETFFVGSDLLRTIIPSLTIDDQDLSSEPIGATELTVERSGMDSVDGSLRSTFRSRRTLICCSRIGQAPQVAECRPEQLQHRASFLQSR